MIGIGVSPFLNRIKNGLDNLVLWLDATKGKVGSPTLSQWQDQSGNDNHANQGTASAQPTDNTTYVTFDGNDNMIVTDNATLDITDRITMYAKFSTVSLTTFMGFFDKYIGSTSGYALLLDSYKLQLSAAFSKTLLTNLLGTTSLNTGAIFKAHATIECTRKFFGKKELFSGRQPQWLYDNGIYYVFYDRWDGAKDNIYMRSSTDPDTLGDGSETLILSTHHYCTISKVGSTYRLIVTDPLNQNLKLYTSTSVGSGYTLQGNLITYGTAGVDNFAVADPKERYYNGVYYLAYSGFTAGTTAQVAWSTSATGLPGSYTKQGVLIPLGASGDFDSSLTADPTFLEMGDGSLLIGYTGYASAITKQQQGYAKANADMTNVVKYSGNPIHFFTDPSFESGTNGPNEPDFIQVGNQALMLYTSNNTASGNEKTAIVRFNILNDSELEAGNETITSKVYVNNVLQNTDVKTGRLGIDYIVPNTHDVYPGGDNVSTFRFNGNIYELKIWNDIVTTV